MSRRCEFRRPARRRSPPARAFRRAILTFWIGRAEDDTLPEYRTGEAGLRWYRSKRTPKDEAIGPILAEHLASEAWTPLAVHSRRAEG